MGKTTPFRASNDELQICRRNEIAGTRLSAGRRRKGEPRFEREEPAVKGRVWRERDGGRERWRRRRWRRRGGPTTRWQSCKVLRVTPGYVMFLRPCVGRSHVQHPGLHRIVRVPPLGGTRSIARTLRLWRINGAALPHRLFCLDQFDNSPLASPLCVRLADYKPPSPHLTSAELIFIARPLAPRSTRIYREWPPIAPRCVA